MQLNLERVLVLMLRCRGRWCPSMLRCGSPSLSRLVRLRLGVWVPMNRLWEMHGLHWRHRHKRVWRGRMRRMNRGLLVLMKLHMRHRQRLTGLRC